MFEDDRPESRRAASPSVNARAGRFLDTAVSETSELRVAVDDFDDGEHAFGPVRWRANAGAGGLVLPQAGDLAWIVEAQGRDRAEWVVVAWEGSEDRPGAVADGSVFVGAYGATGLGVLDEIEALEAARDAAGVGGTVALGAGCTYLVSRPLKPLTGQRWVGTGDPNWWSQDEIPHSCQIKATADFAGAAVVHWDATVTDIDGGRLEGIAVDASLAPGSPDCIRIEGKARDVWTVRCHADNAGGRGFNVIRFGARQPQEARFVHCIATNSATDGFGIFADDNYLHGCEANANARDGFSISGSSNTELHFCRAEWNGRHGLYHNSSDVAVSDDLRIGLTTDRNDEDGVCLASNNNNKPITLDLILGRDGRNGGAGGGNHAGLQIGTEDYVGPVVGRVVTWVANDDDGMGAITPQHGVRVNRCNVLSIHGHLWGQSAAITNVGETTVALVPGTVLVTGSPGSHTVTAPVRLSEGSALELRSAHIDAEASWSGAHVFGARVPGDAFDRVRLLASGKLELGPGDAPVDVSLERAGDAWAFGVGNSVRFPAGYAQLEEAPDPPSGPAAGGARMYARDNGSGKTQLVVLFNTGAVQVIATEP